MFHESTMRLGPGLATAQPVHGQAPILAGRPRVRTCARAQAFLDLLARTPRNRGIDASVVRGLRNRARGFQEWMLSALTASEREDWEVKVYGMKLGVAGRAA